MSNSHYLKYKETIIRCKNQWVKKQGDEYRINVINPLNKICVKKYYTLHRDKILSNKKRSYEYNKEVKRLFSMFDSYET